MVDIEVVRKRLKEIDELVVLLEESSNLSDDEFMSSKKERLSTLYALQLCIQHILDIGVHLLAGKGLVNLDEYRQVFLKLGSEKIIPLDFAKRIEPMAGLRNILVHDYVDVDLVLIREFLKNHLSDFRTFKTHITAYITS